ncbi:MAG: hypothetical protein ACJA0V_004216 [Planctomycetota bacterium]
MTAVAQSRDALGWSSRMITANSMMSIRFVKLLLLACIFAVLMPVLSAQ